MTTAPLSPVPARDSRLVPVLVPVAVGVAVSVALGVYGRVHEPTGFAVNVADLRRARAFAYGGSLIQDIGYYPFSSRFFGDLTHYVRSGDFIEALLRQSTDADEYAFALGALAHYAADTNGHPLAVNRAVPVLYPKLRAKFGDEVEYADSPAAHPG